MLRVAACFALLASSAVGAQAFSFRADPSAVFPLGEPQSRYFLPGGALSLTGMYALAPVLDFEVQLGAALLPPAPGAPVTLGSTFWVGPGLRLRRGRDGSLVVPWLDVDPLAVLPGYGAVSALPVDRSSVRLVGALV